MVSPRNSIWAALVLAAAFGLIALLFKYYQPTLEFHYGEPIGWLAFAIVLPIAISAMLAYTPALRHNPWKAAAACLSVGLVDVVLSLVFSPTPIIADMFFAVVAGFIPVLALFATSRLSLFRREPWTLLLAGPLAYWLTALLAVLMWVIALHNWN